MLLITLYSASAAINLNIGLLHYYTFDDNKTGVNTAIDLLGTGKNLTTSGITSGQAGILGQSYLYNADTDYSRHLNYDQPTNFTWIVWVDAVGVGEGGLTAKYVMDYSTRPAIYYETATDQFVWRDGVSLCTINYAQSKLNTNGWVFLIARATNGGKSNLTLYNTTAKIGTCSLNNNVVYTTDDFYVGQNGGNTRHLNSYIDEIGLWTRALNNSEESYLWNSGAGRPYWQFMQSSVPDTINLSIARPFNNSQFNYNNISTWVLGNASLPWTCRLYINGTVNQTQTLGTGTNINCSFNAILPEGTWNIKIRGNTTSDDENTSTTTIYIDTTNPTITIINWTNGTLRYNQNLTGRFLIQDNFYLFRLNASIDGTQFFGVTEINTTSYDYNMSVNVNGLSPGQHTLTLQVADGHTAQEIPEYDWYNGLFNDYLQYETSKAIIRIDSINGSILDSFTTTKLKDRYVFTYDPWDDTKKVYSFQVTSDRPLFIAKLPHSQIKEWLIIGDHWLDFYIPGTTPTITKLDKYTARIDVTGITKTDKLEFSSIGDLNIITKNYTFITTNLTVIYSSVVNELETQTIRLRINNTNITNTSASLVWNGTVISVTKTNTSTYDQYTGTFLTPAISTTITFVNFTWYYNVTGLINNLTGNITNTQKIIQIGIDNCSVYTTRAVNISLLDESNDSLVTGYINGHFVVWVSLMNGTREFNITWAGNSTYGLCINNATSNYTLNGQLEYGATNYFEKNYYLNNYNVDNVTDILNLYLTKNTTLVTITVTDQDDDPVKDVFIHIQSYDLGTDSFKTTEIIKTDFLGQAFARMILYNQWYQFMLVYNNSVVLQTDATRQTSLTRSFRINLEPDIMQEYDVVQQAVCAISFNPSTNRFKLDFLFPTSNTLTATLNIYNQSIYSKTLINTSSLTAASGTIIIPIGTPENITYLAQSYITIDGTQYSCGILSRTFGHDKDTWGLDGLLMTTFLLIFIVMATIWAPSIAIIATILVVIASTVLGIFYLSWPYLITLIIIGGIAVYRLARTT